MWLTWLAATALLFDTEMSPAEKKETGISKLNASEKAALQKWVAHRYSKKNKASSQPKNLLQENLNNGGTIRLQDGTLWNIHPADTPITQGWITPVDIAVSSSSDPDYPYKLTNSLTGSSVRAKKG